MGYGLDVYSESGLLLFSAARSTIPTLFKKVEFLGSAVIRTVPNGNTFQEYGVLSIPGLTPGKHYTMIMRCTDPVLDSSWRLNKTNKAPVIQENRLYFSYVQCSFIKHHLNNSFYCYVWEVN